MMTPELLAREKIDAMLRDAGWVIQDHKLKNIHAAIGVAIREYPTSEGPADYMLFVDSNPLGVIEAKREDHGQTLHAAEDQTIGYATATLKFYGQANLPFVYESTGTLTRFTDQRDPKPRPREVFSFHRPETLARYAREGRSLRQRLLDLPALEPEGLRDCQVDAINGLETAFRSNDPRTLVRMATGSGKTFTAVTSAYRLLKFAKAKRILFLVDTRNLGEQAESEFQKYQPTDDNRLFPNLFGITRLQSSFVPSDSNVYISTIQRLYAILKGEELDESNEDENPNEKAWSPPTAMPVAYNPAIPIEFFDFVVIDECHRSIYNLWRQVLDYFDAFQIGLTATPDNRTYAYFNQNLASDYGYQQAVLDNVLVDYDVYEISTKVTKEGDKLEIGQWVDTRNRITREKGWQLLDEDMEYSGRQLDNQVVNPNQIRMVLRTMRDAMPGLFPDRYVNGEFEIPKTLIFAKSDSHADDIITAVREVFGEGAQFCKKITYRSEEKPASILSNFRNEYYPRIAVTVDMIATGTDIKNVEALLFMRDVKSRNYYEQMKGRGTRTLSKDELNKTGSPSAKHDKTRFIIFDAIGVEKSLKTDSYPMEKKPGLSMKQVLEAVHHGVKDEDLLTSLSNRLLRLDKQLETRDRNALQDTMGGIPLRQVAAKLLKAWDPDELENLRRKIEREHPTAPTSEHNRLVQEQHTQIIREATRIFDSAEVRNELIEIRRRYDQVVDMLNPDELLHAGLAKDVAQEAAAIRARFEHWVGEHKDSLMALQIYYSQPYRRRELTYEMVQLLADHLRNARPAMAPMQIWDAYARLDAVTGRPEQELVALVSLLRRVSGADATLTPWDATVARNFQSWVFQKQAGKRKFTAEQMQWLHYIRDYMSSSFHIDRDDFDLAPFNAAGGLGKFWQLFGADTDTILNELNEILAA